MLKLVLLSCVAFISYAGIATADYFIDIQNDAKYGGDDRSICCSSKHREVMEEYQKEWDEGTGTPDPEALFTGTGSGTTQYSKECICKDINNTIIFWPNGSGTRTGTIYCCPAFSAIGTDNASLYSNSGDTNWVQKYEMECCQGYVWQYLSKHNNNGTSATDIKERAIQAQWWEGQHSAATEKFCCLPGRRGDPYAGDMEWIQQGVDGQGNEQVGCCDKRFVFASETCCVKAFSDLKDESGNDKTLFIDGGDPNDLSKNKCCAKGTYATIESVSDYDKNTEMDQACCEADQGLFVAKATSGLKEDMCCSPDGPYKKPDELLPKVDENCCKIYGGEVVKDSTDDPILVNKEHCCDPLSPYELFSWDATAKKGTGNITETCCESFGGEYHSTTDTGGNIKGICCLGMKKWDESAAAWSQEDSLECCNGETEKTDFLSGYKYSERCCVNAAETGSNKYSATDVVNEETNTTEKICCIKNSTRRASDNTPHEGCCLQASLDTNKPATWVAEKEICCLENKYVWKFADEVTGTGGMCMVEN